MIGGQSTLTSNYLGDNYYTPGTSSAVVKVISATNITLNLTPIFPVNQPMTVSIAVGSCCTNRTTPPTGSVTLSSGSYTSPAAQLVAGSTAITVPANSLALGNDTLNIAYTGDANYLPSTITPVVTVTAPVRPAIAIASTPVSVTAGATSGNTSTITLTPSGGFTGSVALTASVTSSPAGAQYLPTLSFGSTSPVGITGSAAVTATLTINTTAATAALSRPELFGDHWYATGGAALACLLLFGIPARRRGWRKMLGLTGLFLFLVGGVLACGGGGGGGGTGIAGTTAGAYTITVTGTSGATSANGTVTLTVQ